MAITKAQITYRSEGIDTIVRFNAVMSEQHGVVGEVTKFPVQNGFNVSNHSIRKNRKVTIVGVMTNYQIAGSEFVGTENTNNSRVMYGTLKDLVSSAVPCTVDTNLTTYYPVIFTGLKTKQEAGSTDILEFTLSGEEVQLATSSNKSAPNQLSFSPLPAGAREAKIKELQSQGMVIDDDANVSEAAVDINGSFSIEYLGVSGKPSLMTYENLAYDHTSKRHTHMVHTDDTALTIPGSSGELNWYELMSNDALPDTSLNAGSGSGTMCLSRVTQNILREESSNKIDTPLGELERSAYGVSFGSFVLGGNTSAGQVLMSFGSECYVLGIVGAEPTQSQNDFAGSTLPSINESIAGARNIGSTDSETLGETADTVVYKVAVDTEIEENYGDKV